MSALGPLAGALSKRNRGPSSASNPLSPFNAAIPLHFLTQIRTNEYLGEDSGPPKLSSWVELQVLTKASPTAHWQLSFDTGYNGFGNEVAEVPFDQEAVDAQGSGNTSATFNPAPIIQGPVAASQFLPLLADY